MFQMMGLASGIHKALFWLAQIPINPRTHNPEEASVGITGPNFWVAWIAGVVLAFAIQLVLTNFAAAFGLSFLGRQSDSDSDSQEVNTFGGTVRKIGTALGLGTLVSVTFSLAIACYLTVKLSLIYANVFLGAVVGLVIW
ncbi:MAG: MFS transporter, partial [Chroococcidiopsidaceae cyanobacterium CP_BM_RX_35]|nr:MFS transporter [Chroococcidiopsidaceae cyanobacterium CP_BM_RX_35]